MKKCRSFVLEPEDGYIFSKLYYLKSCCDCGHASIQVVRIDINNKMTSFRKINKKAIKLFERLKGCIKFEEKSRTIENLPYSRFYLNCNEYGRVVKCYSNLKTLKIGKFENRDLPVELEKLKVS